MSRGEWTFLSNHGHVLVALAREPTARTRDVAEAVGITERAVQQILSDLVGQGYVRKEKVGRRNRYTLVRRAHFRHPLEAAVTVGEFLDVVSASVGAIPHQGPDVVAAASPSPFLNSPEAGADRSVRRR